MKKDSAIESVLVVVVVIVVGDCVAGFCVITG